MEPGETAFEKFQPVARWNGKVVESAGLVHLDQFPKGHPCDGGKAPVGFRLEQLLCVPV
jgi:hypothetical protein